MKRIAMVGMLLVAGLITGCRQYDEYTQGFRYKPEFNIDYINYLAPEQPSELELQEIAR